MSTARIRAAVACLGSALVLATASPAHADGYRYWSFWEQRNGSWAYATQGPASLRPADGELQGFRFSVSENSADAARPRGTHDFGSVCGKAPAEAGTKRVGFVLDFGTGSDAADGASPPKPRTACAKVPEDATSAEALASVAKPLRYDSAAMLCAIDGYPRTGCGEQVADSGAESKAEKSAPPAAEADPATGPSAGVLVGVAAVLALGAAAVWQARRNRG